MTDQATPAKVRLTDWLGGWEDYQYKCHHCGHTWWVEGIDA